MKFHTHHFPIGTVFTLNEEMYKHTTSKIPDEEFEVVKIARNGPDSYILETTKKMNPEAFGDMNQAYNISLVKTIIKRGDGPVVIEEREFNPENCKFLEEKTGFEDYCGVKIKKTHFVDHSLQDIVRFCIRNYNTGPGLLDLDAMIDLIAKQSFVKQVRRFSKRPDFVWGVVSVDKKRLKRFIQQNYNRFLVNVKKAQEKEYAMYAEIADRDFDTDFDDGFELGGQDQKTEGSSYDGCDRENYVSYPIPTINEGIDALSFGNDDNCPSSLGELSIKDLSDKLHRGDFFTQPNEGEEEPDFVQQMMDENEKAAFSESVLSYDNLKKDDEEMFARLECLSQTPKKHEDDM